MDFITAFRLTVSFPESRVEFPRIDPSEAVS
jgi:hypothetical protein